METFFNSHNHPDIADTPLKGRHMKALADMLDIFYEQDQPEPDGPAAAMQRIASRFAAFCRNESAQKHGFSIDEANGLLGKIITNPHADLSQTLKTLNDIIKRPDSVRRADLTEAMEGNMAQAVKLLMSLCVAAQEGRTDEFLAMVRRTSSESLKVVASLIDSMDRHNESIDPSTARRNREELINGIGISMVASWIEMQNRHSQLARTNNPVASLVKSWAASARESVDAGLAMIHDLDLSSKAGTVRLEQIKKQLMEQCASRGLRIIDRSY